MILISHSLTQFSIRTSPHTALQLRRRMTVPSKVSSSMQELARIISATSRDIYPVRHITAYNWLSTIQRLGAELWQWKQSLPPHLGTVRPSSLVSSPRRQSLALRLGFFHALMHIHRAVLIQSHAYTMVTASIEKSVTECLHGAKTALETVDAMINDGALFYSFRWSQYVFFCALSFVFICTIQAKKGHAPHQQHLYRPLGLVPWTNRPEIRRRELNQSAPDGR
jgi:hypothetical protein